MDRIDFARKLEQLSALERVQMAVETFGQDLVLTTSFGPTAGVLLHLATLIYPQIRVINVRHGYETNRTQELADFYIKQLRLNIQIYDAPRIPLPTDDGASLRRFKELVKVQPMRRALKKEMPRAWLSGLMAEETPERRKFGFAQWNRPILKIYPLYDWRRADAVDYCIKRGLPLNDDYFDPCKGSDQSLECGIHLQDLSASA